MYKTLFDTGPDEGGGDAGVFSDEDSPKRRRLASPKTPKGRANLSTLRAEPGGDLRRYIVSKNVLLTLHSVKKCLIDTI